MSLKSQPPRFIKKHGSAVLALVLVVEMLVSPAVDFHPHFGALLAGLMWVVLILAARFMSPHRFVIRTVYLFAGLWFVARLLEAFGNPAHLDARLAPIFGLFLACALLWGIHMRAIHVERSPGTAIAESFIAYLLIAIAFAELYWVLNLSMPDAFNQHISPHEISTLLYFSMVTISSIGYGNIAPVNPYVRMVAAFEGVIGLFYIAVIVARLVASYHETKGDPLS